jgi:hypothetical protein
MAEALHLLCRLVTLASVNSLDCFMPSSQVLTHLKRWQHERISTNRKANEASRQPRKISCLFFDACPVFKANRRQTMNKLLALIARAKLVLLTEELRQGLKK